MTQEPFTVTEDTSLEDIVDLMEKNNVTRLPVTPKQIRNKSETQ